MSGLVPTQLQITGARSIFKTCAKMGPAQEARLDLTQWIMRTLCCVVC